ncbi:hypothetical protein D9M69_626190 [compost metagenome]
MGHIKSSGASSDLPATARRAVRATLYIGAHYGYGLREMPEDLRQTFIDEVDRVLDVLSNYAAHYPGYDPDEEGPSASPLSQDQILAVEYHRLRHFIEMAGLEH